MFNTSVGKKGWQKGLAKRVGKKGWQKGSYLLSLLARSKSDVHGILATDIMYVGTYTCMQIYIH